MSIDRTARIAIGVFAALFLACVLFISWKIWELRPRTVSLAAPPLSLLDDATSLALAHTAMRETGYDPADFAPPPPGTGAEFAPDHRRYDFIPASGTGMAGSLGIHVRLEQQGATVRCDVLRKK
jgi:hypothetical protein